MAGKTITMDKLKQILRLKKGGMPFKTISKSVGISRNTVKKYIRLLDDMGISIDKALDMDSHELGALLDEPFNKPDNRYRELEEFFPYMQKELGRPGVNRWLLWGEYKSKYPEGYSYSHFCLYYRLWRRGKEATLHIEQIPGDKFYLDYTGKKLHVVDKPTGEIKDVEVYASCLGYSGLTYVEGTYSQGKEDYINASQNAFHYMGGVPRVMVPDNTKSGVTKANKYEPILNDDFLDFANHYGTAVLPARSNKPRDKAIVEKAISTIYSRIFAPLRNKTFYSLEELNQAIKPLLEKHNNQPLQGKELSRREYFEQYEKHLLGSLPEERYEIKEFATVKVMKNCHVRLYKDIHYYSVPYKYIGEKVKIEFTCRHVSIYHKHERIAFHKRDYKKYGYTTIKEHLPSAHQFVSEWNPGKFLKWAESIDPAVKDYIKVILDSKVYPEQAYRSCVGILSLEKKESRQRLIDACKRAAYYNNYGYWVIVNIIKKNLDKLPFGQEDSTAQSLPEHDNIRGAGLYK